MKTICVVITSRASYSRFKSALIYLSKSQKIDLKIVCAASLVLDNYGKAKEVIANDGLKIYADIYSIVDGNNLYSMAKSIGTGILDLVNIFQLTKPNAVITIADRFETMSTAISASVMNIPLIHIQGGENTGSIDDKIRNSITKLADYHFVSNREAFEKIASMDERENRIFNTGCPSIDLAREVEINPEIDFNPFEKYRYKGHTFDIHKEDYIVVLQHPDTFVYDESEQNMDITLEAINNFSDEYHILVFSSNLDAGANGVEKSINKFMKNHSTLNFSFFVNMNSMDFLKILYNSTCFVGNSSVGIRECSYLRVPVVNIGNRQIDRLRGNNVIDCDHEVKQVIRSINKQINNKKENKIKKESIYGDGYSGQKICNIIEDLNISLKIRKKYPLSCELNNNSN